MSQPRPVAVIVLAAGEGTRMKSRIPKVLHSLCGRSMLGHLPAAHAAYVTGRQFFPNLITAPFHDGLGVAFAFAIAASLIAAIASLLTGPRPRPDAAPESLGAELAGVAGDAGLEPSEIVGTDQEIPETGAPESRGNGQSPAVTKSAGKKPG